MPRIKIENFGPIKDSGWIDVKEVTVFIGNQGSGKSTVAKLISTFMWIEKALVRGDFDEKKFLQKDIFKEKFLQYHRIENYLNNSTHLLYEGEYYVVEYDKNLIKIDKKNEGKLPQIMYVPAERNLVSYIEISKDLKLNSESLIDFFAEFENAKRKCKIKKLPIDNTEWEYNEYQNLIYIKKGDTYKIKLSESASGFQSLVPLFIVSEYLSHSIKDKENKMSLDERQKFQKEFVKIQENSDLTDEQKKLAISGIAVKFNKTSFINIVEEPEQNLFPESQWELLKKLLECNNMCEGNKLIITTHSPYMINFLSIAIQAGILKNKIKNAKNKDVLLEKLEKIIPLSSTVLENNVSVYQLDNGCVYPVPTVYGIPSDDNYLNKILGDGNDKFGTLFEIEEEME